IEFINCSQGGAKIKGTRYQLLQDLIPPSYTYTREDFIEQLSKKTALYDDSIISNVQNRIIEQCNWLKQALSDFNTILKHLLKLEALSRTNQSKCMKNIAEIERLWGSIIVQQNFTVLLEDMLV